MSYLDIIKKIEQGPVGTAADTMKPAKAGPVRPIEHNPTPAALAPESLVVDTENDVQGSLVAVKIGGSVVGEFWFCLSDTEPFDLGDGLPVYRPAEIKALKGKGYGPEALQAVHRAKVILDGKIVCD